MSDLRIRPLAGGHFAVDDGTQLLTVCPCCDKQLTEHAAQTIVRGIEEGKHTLEALVRLADLMAAARNASEGA